MEGTNAGIWDWENINKDQQWWSPKLYELLGYTPTEFSPDQHSFRNLLAEKSDYPRLVNDFKRHLENREPFSVEYKLKCKDGSYRWFQGSGQAKWSHDQKPVRMVGSFSGYHRKESKRRRDKREKSAFGTN